MVINLATPWLHFGSALLLLAVAARGAAGHQPSGVYATTPGALASYEYHVGVYQTELLPLDAIITFSGDNPPTMLTATFYKPIIGALSDGTPIYPIGAIIPLTVTGASSNGQDFTGDLLGTQYLLNWSIEPAGDELVWNGVVGWAGGRYEQTTNSDARLIRVDADFDEDGDVDGADFLTWQRGLGVTGGATHNQGDADGDGSVTGNDLTLWQRLGPAGAGLASAIPEPQALTLLALAAALVSTCRFRR
jgi:hypothetical protein